MNSWAFLATCDLDFETVQLKKKLERLVVNVRLDNLKWQIFRRFNRPDALKVLEFLEVTEKLFSFSKFLENDCNIGGDIKIKTLIPVHQSKWPKKLWAVCALSLQNVSWSQVTGTTSTSLDHVFICFLVETETLQFTLSDHYASESSKPPTPGKEQILVMRPQTFRNLKNVKVRKHSTHSFYCIRSWTW